MYLSWTQTCFSLSIPDNFVTLLVKISSIYSTAVKNDLHTENTEIIQYEDELEKQGKIGYQVLKVVCNKEVLEQECRKVTRFQRNKKSTDQDINSKDITAVRTAKAKNSCSEVRPVTRASSYVLPVRRGARLLLVNTIPLLV